MLGRKKTSHYTTQPQPYCHTATAFVLQALSVVCKMPWPLALVLDPTSMQTYNNILTFLFQVSSLPDPFIIADFRGRSRVTCGT